MSDKPISKPSCGKLIIRKDIASDVPMLCNNTIPLPEVNTDIIPFSKSGSTVGKTASISVVQSDQLLESRVLMDNNNTSTSFNKVSIVPEQQLLESNLGSSTQSLSLPNIGNGVVKIQIRKQPPRENCSTYGDFTGPTDLSTRQPATVEEIVTPVTCNGIVTESQPDVEVVCAQNNATSIGHSVNSDNIIDQPFLNADRELNHDSVFQMDTEEDLQVILTSSHQHHLYHCIIHSK